MPQFDEFALTPQDEMAIDPMSPDQSIEYGVGKGWFDSLPASYFDGDATAMKGANYLYGGIHLKTASPEVLSERIKMQLAFESQLRGNKEQRGTKFDAMRALKEEYNGRMAPHRARQRQILTEMFGPQNAETLVSVKEINPNLAAVMLGAAMGSITRGEDPTNAIEALAIPVKDALTKRATAKALRDKQLGIEYEQVGDEMDFEREQFADELNAAQAQQIESERSQKAIDLAELQNQRSRETHDAQTRDKAMDDVRQALLTGDPSRIQHVVNAALVEYPDLHERVMKVLPEEFQPTSKQSLDIARTASEAARTTKLNTERDFLEKTAQTRINQLQTNLKISGLNAKAITKNLEYLDREKALGVMKSRLQLKQIEQAMSLARDGNLRGWYQAVTGNDLAQQRIDNESLQDSFDQYQDDFDNYMRQIQARDTVIAQMAEEVLQPGQASRFQPILDALEEIKVPMPRKPSLSVSLAGVGVGGMRGFRPVRPAIKGNIRDIVSEARKGGR